MRLVWIVAATGCLLSGCLCQSDNYLDESYVGELYYSSEEEPYVDPRSQHPRVVTPRPVADVNYEVTLEEGTEEDLQHPSLRKYGTYYDPAKKQEFLPKKTTPKPTTRRTTTATTTPRTVPTRRGSSDRPRGGQPKLTTTERSTNAPSTPKKTQEVSAENVEEEKGNLLAHLDYRKEDRSCPDGQVLDIYGYCREIFLEESRDWNWWINIRNFIFGSRDSGYLSSY